MKKFVDASVATTIAETITLPICTIKTNHQNTESKYIMNTVKNIYDRAGIKGFYKASLPSIGSQVFSTSSKYYLYNYFQQLNLPYSNNVLNGLMGGVISSFITHPIDTMKIHYQMGTPFGPEFKKYGPKLFYRGYSKTFGKVCLGSTLFFPLYSFYFDYFQNPVYASLASSIISTCIMHPLDFLKTRHIYNLSLYQGFSPFIYYKGLSLNLLRVVPHFTIVMSIIHYLENIHYL